MIDSSTTALIVTDMLNPYEHDRDSSSLDILPEYPRALRRLLELIDACGLADRLKGMDRLSPPAPARASAGQRSAGPA